MNNKKKPPEGMLMIIGTSILNGITYRKIGDNVDSLRKEVRHNPLVFEDFKIIDHKGDCVYYHKFKFTQPLYKQSIKDSPQ